MRTQQHNSTAITSNTIAAIAPAGSPSSSSVPTLLGAINMAFLGYVAGSLQFSPNLLCEHTSTVYSSASGTSITVY